MAMKINEKVLSGIATCSSPVDREGWLNKKESNKSFVKRWFVLKGNLLFYFDKKGDKEPIGVIILAGYRIELDEDDKQFTFKIVFHGMQDRAYVLAADNQDSMELWMKTLACAGFDYMKLMVADLQRQIDEIEETSVQNNLKDPRKNPSVEQRYNPFNRSYDRDAIKQLNKRNGVIATHSKDMSNERLTFHDIHSIYGEQILQDREEWFKLKEEEETPEEPLINL